MAIRALIWSGDALRLLDQRELPRRERWLQLRSWQEVAEAIRGMAVRGAPSVGIAAGYALALAALHGEALSPVADELVATRPTGANLHGAVRRVLALDSADVDAIVREVRTIESEESERNEAISRFGAELLPRGSTVMTLCNTGSLATPGLGTALGIIRHGHATGRVEFVVACETRPLLQGLRLTAWELQQDGIPFAVIAESAAADLMRKGRIDAVVVGADRIAANGDTANKIGTYMLAVLARHHGVQFYVAAPSTTLDLTISHRDQIPVEVRPSEEVTTFGGVPLAPPDVAAINPAFDVTPAELITAIITEHGVHRAPYAFEAAAVSAS